MIKCYFFLFYLSLFLAGISIQAQSTSIPDENFEQALIDLGIDTDGLNGSVITANISGLVSLNVASKNIGNLTGIEDFTSLKTLTCYNNLLTSLDLTSNTELTQLQCFSNQITTIDLSKNTKLNFINFNGNQLTTIDLQNNPLVSNLGLSNNQLTSLDLSNNSALYYLQCQGNQLNELDVSQNTALYNLVCGSNLLTSLDLSNNPDLSKLNCNDSNLSELHVGQNTLLTELSFTNNPLISSIDVSNNLELTYLNCSLNPLISDLDLSNNTKLTDLWCHNNTSLTALDLSHNVNLELFYGPETPFVSLDFSQNPELVRLYCGYNLLIYLNVKNGNNTSIIGFDARNCFALTCIQVDNAEAANGGTEPYTNWLKYESTTYAEDCASLSLDDPIWRNSISLYPNPITNALYIDSKIPLTKIVIYSLNGTRIKEIDPNQKSIQLDNLQIGMYIVKIHTVFGYMAKKLIKG